MHSILNEFIEYEELKGYREDTIKVKRKNVLRFLRHIYCEYPTVTRDDIVDYLIRLMKKGVSQEKINRHIAHLSQFYNYLIYKEKALVNPLESIQRLEVKRDSHTGIFTEDEIKDILKASSTNEKRKSLQIMKRDRSIIELFYSTGLRLHELRSLDVEDVDFESREIHIYNAKGDSERIVPVGDEALKAIQEYLNVRQIFIKPEKEFDALFISRQGNRLADVSIRKMIRRRKDEAKIDAKGATHAFRRSCASHMLKNGAPIDVIAKILGHECLESTDIYTNVPDKDLREIHKSSHPKLGR